LTSHFFFDRAHRLRYGRSAEFLFKIMNALPKLLLASASPRRRQLLEALGLSFTVIPAEVEEIDPTSESIEAGVLENAKNKGLAGLKHAQNQNDVIIAADTLVVLKDKVLGKPKNSSDVLAMLGSLSGQSHQVVTGMVLQTPTGNQSSAAVSSFVTFRNLSEDEIKSYAATREPYDKAGSYAIQGLGAIFIEKIEGSYTNIMGFPIERFLIELPKITGLPVYQWFLP
jgi:septum formation protein